MGFRFLLSLLLCATSTACVQRTVRTSVHPGPRVSVGFRVRDADGIGAHVGLIYQTPLGVVVADGTTPWHGPVLSLDEGSLVEIDASRPATDGSSGSLHCRVDTFGGAFLLEELVTAQDSCGMRGVVSLTDVNLGAYGPRS
jgi:hypothetical protein